MTMLLRPVLRAAFAWGRWAVRHPRAARLVYIAEYAGLGVLYWWWFGMWAGVIATAAVLVFVNGALAWGRYLRRRRGVPPLPSVWRTPRQ